MKKRKKILLYGAKSTALIVSKMLEEKNIKVHVMFDKYLKEPSFNTNIKFSNKFQDFEKFAKECTHFFVCIGMMDGKIRSFISKKLKSLKLKELSILSDSSIVDKTAKYGDGTLIMPNAVVHKYSKLGNNCLLNVNSVVDHECEIGDGVHIMGSAYLAGRVKVKNFASIGANATVLPDIEIGENAIVGAGSVVTKNVKKNEIVVGNPAKFLKYNKKKFDYKI